MFTDADAFRRGWLRFAVNIEPDSLNTAVTRMKFLGQGLRMLHQNNAGIPSSLNELERLLRRMRFRVQVASHGLILKCHAHDKRNFMYRCANSTTVKFHLIRSVDGHLPPRITAKGLNPIPTLIWSARQTGATYAGNRVSLSGMVKINTLISCITKMKIA